MRMYQSTESSLFFLRLDYDKSPNTFRAYGFTGVPAIIHVRAVRPPLACRPSSGE